MYGYAQNGTITNNPFVSDPTNAQGRYPDISGTSSPPTGQFTSWTQQNNGYQSPQQSGGYQQQPQYTPGYNMGGGSGFVTSPMQSPVGPQPFQPTSSFGQQLTAQVNGSSYGYLNPQLTQQQQQQPYRPALQQLSSPSYVAQFDPYASLGQLDNSNQQMQVQTAPTQAYQQSQSTGTQLISPTLTSPVSVGPNGQPHPREYIRSHKSEMEAWDAYAWKQAIGAFEALKAAWGQRKTEIEQRATQLRNQLQYGPGYYSADQIQQETARLQGLHKEADSHFGSVAASTFQMQEVFSGYRQSGDMASKRRVREAVNSALQGLPDWPQPLL
ncbi:hypothetical protein ONZ45_g8954 [Pleurotus djamor]|nr:hypothetical protein ONZ45_g8954 [Pleurotus djamor]